MKRHAFPILVCALIAGAGPLHALPAAAEVEPPRAYVQCMDRAEAKFVRCLDGADTTEFLCWSKFGYDKLWCSTKYMISSIFE
jgi:hypothetical protein